MLTLLGGLAVGGLIGSQVCPHQASGQLPLTPRMLTHFDQIQAAHAKQIERLWTVLYEGYLTRPGHERDEDEKFMRGLRTARIVRERAQTLIFEEPWRAVTPIP